MMRVLLTGLILVSLCNQLIAQESVETIDERATHEHAGEISISQGTDDTLTINAFCLDRDGLILAACGAGPGEIRVLKDDGTLLRSWKLAVKPEAIGAAGDGTIIVGGDGKLFRFASDGKLLNEADSPHAERLRSSKDVLRQEAIAYIKRTSGRGQVTSRVTTYQQILDQLEAKAAKQELNAQEQQILKILPPMLEKAKIAAAAIPEKEDASEAPSEEAIKQRMDLLLASKMRIASVSTDDSHVFIATRGLTGYGFAVWKLNQDFTGGEELVTGLSGCCGQMDVQACSNGLYVAENSRHRVVHYDTLGEQVNTWGKGDRKGIEGFTSCCNPMNVCFGANGDVFTAESNTGRIKRFSADGELLAYIGDVKLVPGCKNVSVAVSPDQSRVYMLDITRNHIVVMKKRTKGDSADDKSTASID
jgi:sugar lactone lactonase YvrE